MQPLIKIAMAIVEHLNRKEERENEQRSWNALFVVLNELKADLKQNIHAIRRELTNAKMRDITASVLDHEEAFRELLALRKEVFRNNLIEKTRESKNEIEQELKDENLTNEDVLKYYGLYYTVVPLRAACFEMIDRGDADVGGLIVSELSDLIETEGRVKKAISAWTEQRVSPIESNIRAEPTLGGSILAITLTFTIDGKSGGRVESLSSEPGNEYEEIGIQRQEAIENMNEREWSPFKEILENANDVVGIWKKETA